MVLDSGSVKIADFGVADAAVGAADRGRHRDRLPQIHVSRAGHRATAGWPLRHFRARRRRLYEMLTGTPPFTGDNLAAVLQQVIHSDPVAPSQHRALGA